jgi:putative membrane protein
MHFISRIIIHILANAIAIKIADFSVSGFNFSGSWIELLFAGVILGIFNSLIKPVVELIALPVIFLTLGLFAVIINIALLILASNFLPNFSIHGFWAAFWGIIVISLVNHVVMAFAPKKNKA